jgi:cytoplasmic iron level regulating protein YaaA (DUF328/UPF0246 family)
MLVILSPSKTLDFESPSTLQPGADPEFISHSKMLIAVLQKKTPKELSALMQISPRLAELNALRFSEWRHPFPPGKARPALPAFKGEVYEGLKAWELDEAQARFAVGHVRILSGLYGLLKPTDAIMPYRLEMGTPLQTGGSKNLYEFWGDRITKALKSAVKASGSNILVNLASEEYSKAVDFNALRCRVITPVFKEYRDGKYKFITFNGKRARGLMTRFIIDREIDDPEELKLFDYEGYSYMEELSKGDTWLFVR